MASRIEAKQVTVPAGTAQAAPQLTALPFADGVVSRLEIRVPPGPSGLLGFQIWHSNQRVIPRRDNTWITADDERIDWTLNEYPTGGAWQAAAYNTDIYDHTFYLRFHIDEIPLAVATTAPLVPIIEEAPAQSAAVPNQDEPEDPFADEPVSDAPDEVSV